MSKPDFDALRRQRDETIATVIAAARKQLFGEDAPEDQGCAHVSYGGGSHDCYCACGTGGPCEHDWTGPARDILDDGDEVCGSEHTCARCGMGSMQHSLATVDF